MPGRNSCRPAGRSVSTGSPRRCESDGIHASRYSRRSTTVAGRTSRCSGQVVLHAHRVLRVEIEEIQPIQRHERAAERVGERRRRDIRLLHERRRAVAVGAIVIAENRLMEHAGAAAERCLAVTEHIPRKAEARGDVLERRVVEERVAYRRRPDRAPSPCEPRGLRPPWAR